MNYEKDFVMKKKDLIYFDNASTTFKPLSVINKEVEYLSNYTSNYSRGDYDISFKVFDEVENTRNLVKEFINAKDTKEIIFTSGTTFGINQIVFGFFKYYLKEYDEIILNRAEHASNILPWLVLAKEKNLIIKYAPLDKDNKLTIDSIKSLISKRTKVISLAHITNVIGDKRDIKQINELAHKNNILTVVDASQSICHTKVDVVDMDIDFMVFSSHKMLGPTGVGVLYGKYELLEKTNPIIYGGGMNEDYSEEEIKYLPLPSKLEAGTMNLSGIIAFSKAIEYIQSLQIEEIERKEKFLRKYLITELKKIWYVNILNEKSDSSIVLINIAGISPSDLGLYLNTKKICTRSGKHCTKILKKESGFENSTRISLCFYNTYEEIDLLISALKNIEEIKKV